MMFSKDHSGWSIEKSWQERRHGSGLVKREKLSSGNGKLVVYTIVVCTERKIWVDVNRI